MYVQFTNQKFLEKFNEKHSIFAAEFNQSKITQDNPMSIAGRSIIDFINRYEYNQYNSMKRKIEMERIKLQK